MAKKKKSIIGLEVQNTQMQPPLLLEAAGEPDYSTSQTDKEIDSKTQKKERSMAEQHCLKLLLKAENATWGIYDDIYEAWFATYRVMPENAKMRKQTYKALELLKELQKVLFDLIY